MKRVSVFSNMLLILMTPSTAIADEAGNARVFRIADGEISVVSDEGE